MRSLLLRIFLWFWITAFVTGIALIITFVFGPGNVPNQWHNSLADTARSTGAVAVEEFERGGAAAASVYIASLESDSMLRACLFDKSWQPLAGRDCGTFRDMMPESRGMTGPPGPPRRPAFRMRYGIVRASLTIPGSGGREYIFATELPAGPRAALGIGHAAMALRFGVALLVSGFICYLLAVYLATPIVRLRRAAQRIAAGDLSSRVDEPNLRRSDELGGLVRDFNRMADRIGELVGRQRQLIYDISHELRSPLARLNVALDLSRSRKGDDPAFDHMDRDLEQLNSMIERLLTIARLDTTADPPRMEPLDLAELLRQIVQNAGFESQSRGVTVTLECDADCRVQGNPQLLSSAIENVIRNAIHYTDADSSVDVTLRRDSSADPPRIVLAIADHGPGVPESDLAAIFRPFYRVAQARERSSGGAGLGLAIAERVVDIHSGSIRAENISEHGLKVEISLPALAASVL